MDYQSPRLHGKCPDVAYKCLACGYSLRNLPQQVCPECGASFNMDEIRFAKIGLRIERQLDQVSHSYKKYLLPAILMLSPRKSFQYNCRLEWVLSKIPTEIFVATLIMSIIAVFATIETRNLFYNSIDSFYKYLLPRDSYFCSLFMFPLDVIFVIIEICVILVTAMLVSWRRLNPRQMVALCLWLTPFSVIARLLSTLYELCSYKIIGIANFRHCGNMIAGLLDIPEPSLFGFKIFLYSRLYLPSILLGFFSGIAIGTVARRRRAAIVTVSITVAVALFPVFELLQKYYYKVVALPAKKIIYGPVPAPQSYPKMTPSFNPGGGLEGMEGAWLVQIDSDKSKWADVWSFSGNGVFCAAKHMPPILCEEAQEKFYIDIIIDNVSRCDEYPAIQKYSMYRATGSCGMQNGYISLNLWVSIALSESKNDSACRLLVYEYDMSGRFDFDDSVIRGTGEVRYLAEMPHRDRSSQSFKFVMQRTQEQGASK